MKFSIMLNLEVMSLRSIVIALKPLLVYSNDKSQNDHQEGNISSSFTFTKTNPIYVAGVSSVRSNISTSPWDSGADM